MEKAPVYSPTQISWGSFLGGPAAAVYFLWKNFLTLGNEAAARNTLLWGSVFCGALVVILPFVPEKFPNFLLPVAYSIGAQQLAQNFQLPTQAIAKSEQYGFMSGWKVFGQAVLFLVVTLVVVFAIYFIVHFARELLRAPG